MVLFIVPDIFKKQDCTNLLLVNPGRGQHNRFIKSKKLFGTTTRNLHFLK